MDIQGSKASGISKSNDVRALLVKAERKKMRESELVPDEEVDDAEDDDPDGPQYVDDSKMIRINSKTV